MKKKSIHFVGIKGVGMAPLAIIAKEAGFVVSGCDIDEAFITDKALKKAKIQPLIGFSSDHIADVDIVVTTGAHGGFDNKEVLQAKEKGKTIWTQGQAVGEFMAGKLFGKKFEGISIAGSHGKTTTTAMLATIFRENRLDPSFLIGTGEVASLGAPGHFGRGKYFIAEADEYATEPTHDAKAKFLWQHPKMAIFTNIELDHPDLYPTVEKVREAFLSFAHNISPDGVLILNGDDSEAVKLRKSYDGRVLTFGKFPSNDFVLKNIRVSGTQTFFWVESHGATIGEFTLKVAGEHHAYNALGAIIASLEAGLPIDKIRESLLAFTGSKRRSEAIGRTKHGALLFDDYGHHPTEITKTLLAFKQAYPRSKIICVFQPHTYSRTKKLFDQFISSFQSANEVLITNIYASLREEVDPTVTSEQLVRAINKLYGHAHFLPELHDVVEYIDAHRFGEDTVIITMGAGDVYKISEKLVAKRA